MPSIEQILAKHKNSVSDGEHFTPDEKRFILSGYKRRGMQWLLKYQQAMELRERWDKIDRGEIECYVDTIVSSGGTTKLTCK